MYVFFIIRGYYDLKTKDVSVNLHKYKENGICCSPLEGKTLRVSYTTFPPYFEFPDQKVSINLSRQNLGVPIDFLVGLRALGFCQIEWACKKIAL